MLRIVSLIFAAMAGSFVTLAIRYASLHPHTDDNVLGGLFCGVAASVLLAVLCTLEDWD